MRHKGWLRALIQRNNSAPEIRTERRHRRLEFDRLRAQIAHFPEWRSVLPRSAPVPSFRSG